MTGLSITIVDILVGVVILVSAGLAAWRGLMRETLAILSWVAAAYLAFLFFPTLRPLAREYIAPAWLADAANFAILFIVVLVPLSFISFRLAERVKKSEIGAVDRSLGFLFGVGRGVVIIGFAYIVFGYLVPPANDPDWLKQARVYPLVQEASLLLRSVVPDVDIGMPSLEGPSASSGAELTTVSNSYGARERGGLDTPTQAMGAAKDSSR